MMKTKEINDVIDAINESGVLSPGYKDRSLLLVLWQIAAELDSISYHLRKISDK